MPDYIPEGLAERVVKTYLEPSPLELHQRAIEHAEYLAKAIEHYFEIISKLANRPDWDPDAISDCYSSVQSRIYEFRKRAERAKAIEQELRCGIIHHAT